MTPTPQEQSQLDRIEKNLNRLTLMITGQGGTKEDIENSIFYRLNAHDKWRQTTSKMLWLFAGAIAAGTVELFF